MTDYRRHHDEGRFWFGDDRSRQRRGNDERDDRFPYGGDRSARWEGPREDRDYGGYDATGSYRTDDRGYHDRYRGERHRDEAYRDRDEGRYGSWRPRYRPDADAEEYFRAAREQRNDFMRWEAQSPGAEFGHQDPPGDQYRWRPRERGGYWRQYESERAPYAGRGPKNYQRSDDRIREEICDCMTDDPVLDASEIVVQVSSGVVTISGTVSSRDQKRRAEDVAERVSGVKDVTNQLRVSRQADGHFNPASPAVSQAYGSGTPSKSTASSNST